MKHSRYYVYVPSVIIKYHVPEVQILFERPLAAPHGVKQVILAGFVWRISRNPGRELKFETMSPGFSACLRGHVCGINRSILCEDRMRAVSRSRLRSFIKAVYAYYDRAGRDLPWRRTRDPFRILVSEVMLQQTQVDRVVEKYGEFLRVFPDARALARAPLAEVLRAWQGLGYNRRARMLHECAKMLVERHRGRVPREQDALVRLPGIGQATAAAIRAYAFNEPVVYIETNIRSVFLHRFFRGRQAMSDAALEPLVSSALDRGNPRRWYNALMDYGVMLKSTQGNAARRSVHYVRQKRFEGSLRQARGAVLKVLLARACVRDYELPRVTGLPAERVEDAAQQLTAEGLITRRGSRLVAG